jgi:hypothetical protein
MYVRIYFGFLLIFRDNDSHQYQIILCRIFTGVLGHFIGIKIAVSAMHIFQPVCNTDVAFTATVIFIRPTKFLTRNIQRDSKRLTQFRTSIFPELYVVCE